jgi:hypothetical protein
MTVLSQWTIVFVFWAFCAAQFLPEVGWIWRLGLIGAHTFPFAEVMVEFFICDSMLRMRYFWHSWIVGVIYAFVNYYYT